MKGALLGVPFGAEVGLEVVTVEAERLGAPTVEPAPAEEITNEGDFPVPIQRFEPDDAFYVSGEAYPAGAASLGFDATLRHQRTVQLFLHPFHYDPRGGLVVNRRIVVRVTLGPSRQPAHMVPAAAVEREWEGIYAGTVLNYGQARQWRMRPAPRAGAVGRAARPSEAYRIEVTATGIHRLEYSDLEDAGLRPRRRWATWRSISGRSTGPRMTRSSRRRSRSSSWTATATACSTATTTSSSTRGASLTSSRSSAGRTATPPGTRTGSPWTPPSPRAWTPAPCGTTGRV